ncbi:hypothetical protein C8J55DRAFT_607295 [Lentinula edodes]|uniref:Uncharacterized protein n=1 Tax=Lentinula lateritia TaxID=40482 RepID=A0A9W9A4B5_9AGAR|nr:hypothetical protein C8J55DRAFT_607295 [Lentinula edodes]
MALESPRFQPSFADLKMLMDRANRTEDHLAPYAESVLNILKAYKSCPSHVKPLVEVIFTSGVEIMERNSKIDLEDLQVLRHVETDMLKSDNDSRESITCTELYIARFQSRITQTISESLEPPAISYQSNTISQLRDRGIFQVTYSACTFNSAKGDINTTTNTNASSHSNCNNNFVDSQVRYDSQGSHSDSSSSDVHLPPAVPPFKEEVRRRDKINRVPPLSTTDIGTQPSNIYSSPSTPYLFPSSPLACGPSGRVDSPKTPTDTRCFSSPTHSHPVRHGRETSGDTRKDLLVRAAETKLLTPVVDERSLPFLPLQPHHPISDFRPKLGPLQEAYMFLHRQLVSTLSLLRIGISGSLTRTWQP